MTRLWYVLDIRSFMSDKQNLILESMCPMCTIPVLFRVADNVIIIACWK